jgi:IQ calmodulin-binding motif
LSLSLLRCRKRYHAEIARLAAIKIQANWRVKVARREFLKSKTSAVLIQSSFRGAKARGEFAMQVFDAMAVWVGMGADEAMNACVGMVL